MTNSRIRFPSAVFQQLFQQIVRLCKDAGLISGDCYFIDSSLVRADASKDSFRAKRQTEQEYLKALERGEKTEESPRSNFHGHIFDTAPSTRTRWESGARERRETTTYSLPPTRMPS